MRRPALLALLMGPACATPPCDLTTCGAVCQAQGLQVGSPGAPLHEASLNPFELEALRDELEDMRAGARLVPGLSGVCAGTDRCERPYGVDVDGLPNGSYHLYLNVQLPRRARPDDWEATVARTCVTDTDGVRTETRLSEPVPVQPKAGEVLTLQGLAFTVPTPEDGWDCAWRLRMTGPDDRVQTFEGRFRTGTLATERAPATIVPQPAPDEPESAPAP